MDNDDLADALVFEAMALYALIRPNVDVQTWIVFCIGLWIGMAMTEVETKHDKDQQAKEVN